MSMIKIPFLEEILEMLQDRGDKLDSNIEALLDSLGEVNSSLIRVAQALEATLDSKND